MIRKDFDVDGAIEDQTDMMQARIEGGVENGEAEEQDLTQLAQASALPRLFGKYLKPGHQSRLLPHPRRMDPGPVGPVTREDAHRGIIPTEPGQAQIGVSDTLSERLPPETRVQSGTPNPVGTPVMHRDGKRYYDRDLNAPGTGSLNSTEQVVGIFEETINEIPGARDVVDAIERRTGRRMWPKPVEFWNKALQLSDRARYWYEISSERFKEVLPDLDETQMYTFLRLVAGTSPQADPHVNLRRAIGTMSQHMQGKPITMDLTSQTAVAQALTADGISGPKVNNFGDTFLYLQGNDAMPPLSTNDRQVASSFGLTGDDIAAHPQIYEVLSRFYMKMRDELNIHNPGSDYETWQLQALGWVQERIEKGNASNDDYAMALDNIITDLKAAGIDVPNNKLTTAVLMDPRVAPIMSTTMDEMSKRGVATIETVSTQTDIGREAAELFDIAYRTGDDAAVKQHDLLVQKSLTAMTRRTKRPGEPKLSAADRVLDAITGERSKLSRMEKGVGSFDGTISGNARIPLPSHLRPDERAGFLGIMGRALRQDATPAVHLKPSVPGAPVADGFTSKSFAVFVPAKVDDRVLATFRDALPDGHEISVKSVANGIEIQVNPRFGPDGSQIAALEDEVATAVIDSLPPALYQKVEISEYHFKSDYVDATQYGEAIGQIRENIINDAAKSLSSKFKVVQGPGGTSVRITDVGQREAAARAYLRNRGPAPKAPGNITAAEGARARYDGRISDLTGAEAEVREIAHELTEGQAAWNKKVGDRLRAADADQGGGP